MADGPRIKTRTAHERLAQARQRFRADPSNGTVGNYLFAALVLSDPSDMHDVAAEVAFWLRHGTLMIYEDKTR